MRTAGHAEYVKSCRFAHQGLCSRIPPSEIVGTTPTCFAFVTVKANRGAVNQMADVRWELYPGVADNEMARAWLVLESNLGLAANTLDAYGRALKSTLHSALTGTPLWSLPPRITEAFLSELNAR